MSASTPVSFSAALLAGGKSTRMGCDKALLPVPGSDLLLWQRQLAILTDLQPQEIFWSGPRREGLPANVHVVPDSISGAGPLAGISACLAAMKSDLLIILAVDLPRMTPLFLVNTLALCSVNCGAVAKRGEFYEPLAAVYPKVILPLANEHLRKGRHALQDFVNAGIQRQCLESFNPDPQDAILFKNVNRREDL